MADEYPKEEIQKIYEALPDNLKEALFSEKTTNDIYNTCVENGLEEKNFEIAKYAGYVLLGLLPPNELEKTLKEKLALTDETSKKVSQEITRLVFVPLKDTLEAIYNMKIEAPNEPSKEASGEKIMPNQELPKKKQGKDIYREQIE